MSDSRLPSIEDFADAEHCVLEDVTVEQPALSETGLHSSHPAEVRSEITIRDRLRGRQTEVRIYQEGWADIAVERRGRSSSHHRIDLRYLDPVPVTERHRPLRLLQATGILAGLSALLAIPVWFGWFTGFSIPTFILLATATIVTGGVTFYLTHEKIQFQTLHGRANAIRFGAGLGTIRRFRKLIPQFLEAIADAAESVLDETAVYLRAEMREHYRLRSEGILSEEECNVSTGKILSEFDGPL